MVTVIFLLFVGLMIAGLVIIKTAPRRRGRKLAALAASRGWGFSPTDTVGLGNSPLTLFKYGHTRGLPNQMWGRDRGLDFVATDFWHWDRDGDHGAVYSVVVWKLPFSVPHITITAKTVLTRLADPRGGAEVLFEIPEFDRRFTVTAHDPVFATELCDQRFISYLLATRPGTSLEAVGPYLSVFRRQLAPNDVPVLVETGRRLIDWIPRLVWTKYPPGPQPAAPDNPAIGTWSE